MLRVLYARKYTFKDQAWMNHLVINQTRRRQGQVQEFVIWPLELLSITINSDT